MKKALYTVLILIIAGLGYLKWQSWQSPAAPVVTASPTPSPVVVASDNLLLETTYFSLSYPKVATTTPVSESADSMSWSLRYMGNEQVKSGRTQTELVDGYSIAITAFPSVVGDDPQATQAESDRQGTIGSCGETSVTQIKSVVITGHNAISFSGGCAGEATSYYLMNKEVLIRITTMAVGSPEVTFDYQQSVDKILASLKLL